jgi:outer membrane protein assembly factor BamB
LLHVGLTKELQTVKDGWKGLSITITRPDNVVETISGINTDSTGGTGRTYVPTMEGTYKLQTHFPAQWYNYSAFDFFSFQFQTVNIYYEADDSPILELVVTSDPPVYWPKVPLPTEYWTRPIDRQNREWSVISGSWLTPSSFFGLSLTTGNDDAPETAHVLWNKPLVIGGLAGGTNTSQIGTFAGDAYEGKFSNSLIIQGILICNKFDSVGSTNVDNWVVAVDLHTGETLWEKELKNPNGTRVIPAFGQIMVWQSFNTQGAFAYLWTTEDPGPLGMFGPPPTTWHAFDPFTGRWIYTMNSIPSGTRMYGPKGEILIYTINQAAGYMTLWNSTAVIDAQGGISLGSWQPQGKIINATGVPTVPFGTDPALVSQNAPFGLNGYQKNITIPKGLPGSVSYQYFDDTIFGYYRGDTIGFFGTTSYNDPPFTIWAFDAKTGILKFNKTHAAPSGNVSLSIAAASDKDRVVCIWSKELAQFWAYSLDNGDKLWGPTEPQNYLDVYAMYPVITYGKLYSNGMSGIMYCYDAKTGDLLWNYTYRDPYGEVLWSNYWSSLRPRIITDGKIYLGQSEHSVNEPMPRGAPFVCLNATTGEEIWSVAGMFRQTDWGGSALIGDSIIATMDSYDQQVYGIGRGPSATTVSAGPKVSVHGSSVLVEGMVTDVSPGTNSAGLAMRFPNGVPAVADESMSDWMLYVYKQFARPTNATGVEVVISVLDPNNNCYEVGRATSDANGFFHCSFIPEVPGEYTIYATFEGSGAYYGSSAETAINIESAPAATPAPTPTPAPMTDTYVLGTGIAIIIAIVIGFALLLLRKR